MTLVDIHAHLVLISGKCIRYYPINRNKKLLLASKTNLSGNKFLTKQFYNHEIK